MFATLLLPTCAFTSDPPDDGLVDEVEIDGPSSFWALVHPTDAPASGSGIYRVDLDTGGVRGPLAVPAAITSPHALFDDGAGLLVGGYVDEDPADAHSLYRLDYDGTELESLSAWGVEGIASADGVSYLGDGSTVDIRDAAWAVTTTIDNGDVVQDVAVDDRSLFVLSNDEGDSIRAYDLDDLAAGPDVITRTATYSNTGYAMTAWSGRLLVVDEDAGGHFLRHIDVRTGETLGITRFRQEGWITAIAVGTGS